MYDKLMALDACDMGVPVVLDLTGGDGYTIVPFEAICKRDKNIRDKFNRMKLHDTPPPPETLIQATVEGSIDVLCYSGTCVDDRDSDACQGYGLMFKKAKFLDKEPSDAILINIDDLLDRKSGKRNVFISNGACVNWPDSLQDLARPKAFLFAFHWGWFQDGDRKDRKDTFEFQCAMVATTAVLRVHNLNERPEFSVDKEMSFYDGPQMAFYHGQEFAVVGIDDHTSQFLPSSKAKAGKDEAEAKATPVTQPVPVTQTEATDKEKEGKLLKWFKKILKSKAYKEDGLSGLMTKLHEFNERWDKIGDTYTYTDSIFLAGEDQVPVYYQYEFDRFELKIEGPGSGITTSRFFDDLFSSAKDAGDLSATTDSDREGELKLANFVFRLTHLEKAGTIDIFALKERSSIWWDIPSIQKRYIIDGKKFEIPKLKLGFKTDGIPSENDSCFPAPSDYLSDRQPTELWIEKCTELEKFCQIVHGLTVEHGVITSIPAFILDSSKRHELLVKFDDGHLSSIPATQLERDFLFQQKEVPLGAWPFGKPEAKLFGPVGFDILKDRFIIDRGKPKDKDVMLSFTTHTGKERTCKLEQKFGDKFFNAERMRTMPSKKGAAPARAPFATGGKKRGGENKGGEQPKQRRVDPPYATYDDESEFDR